MIKRNNKGQFVKGAVNDLTGRRFGKLVVLKLDTIKNRKSYWICKCDCGNIKTIRGDTLCKIQSCGCVKKQQDIKNLKIKNNHKMSNHRCYPIWVGITQRCNNPKHSAYKDYGGRGISICKEWKNPKKFCEWMESQGFRDGLSVERIDVNGNYEPLNCVLIPRSEQAYNKRDTVYYTNEENKKIPLAKESRRRGINPKLVYGRWSHGIRDETYLFYNGNLQKDFPEIFGGFLSK